MNNDQNFAFMNDPRRVEGQKRLDKIVGHIQNDVASNGNAQYYMTVLPQLLKELSDAYENLIIVEAIVEGELIGKV